jgi:hypothetical protein
MIPPIRNKPAFPHRRAFKDIIANFFTIWNTFFIPLPGFFPKFPGGGGKRVAIGGKRR